MANMTARDTIGRFTSTENTLPEVDLATAAAYLRDTAPADFDIDAFHDQEQDEIEVVEALAEERSLREPADIDAYFDRDEPVTADTAGFHDGSTTPF